MVAKGASRTSTWSPFRQDRQSDGHTHCVIFRDCWFIVVYYSVTSNMRQEWLHCAGRYKTSTTSLMIYRKRIGWTDGPHGLSVFPALTSILTSLNSIPTSIYKSRLTFVSPRFRSYFQFILPIVIAKNKAHMANDASSVRGNDCMMIWFMTFSARLWFIGKGRLSLNFTESWQMNGMTDGQTLSRDTRTYPEFYLLKNDNFSLLPHSFQISPLSALYRCLLPRVITNKYDNE